MNNRHNDPDPETVRELLAIIPEKNVRAWESRLAGKEVPVKSIRGALDIFDFNNRAKINLTKWIFLLWIGAFVFMTPVSLLLISSSATLSEGMFKILLFICVYYAIALRIYRNKKVQIPDEVLVMWASATIKKFAKDVSWLNPTVMDQKASIMFRKSACSPLGSKAWAEKLMFCMVAAEEELDRVRLAKGRDAIAIKTAAEQLIECSGRLDQSWEAAEAFQLFPDSKNAMLVRVNKLSGHHPIMSL